MPPHTVAWLAVVLKPCFIELSVHSSAPWSKRFKLSPQLANTLCKRGVLSRHSSDPVQTVDNRRMIPPSKCSANFHELHAEELAHEMHRNLPGCRESLCARLRAEPLRRYTPFPRNAHLNCLRGKAGERGRISKTNLVAERGSREVDCDLTVLE